VVSHTASGGGTFTGSPVTTDPGLGPLAANQPPGGGALTPTQAITTSSPAFNTGQTALTSDQRGVTRPEGPADDIGAYELLVPNAPPTLTKAFSPSTVEAGKRSTLTFTLTNPNAGITLTSISFTDTMPAGITVVTGGPSNNACGGTLTLTKNTITVSGASLSPSGQCTISTTVHADGAKAGTLLNTTSAPTSAQTGPGTAASAALTVAHKGNGKH
jgi:uncharacterized repeat protein (TIGR01451 family)